MKCQYLFLGTTRKKKKQLKMSSAEIITKFGKFKHVVISTANLGFHFNKNSGINQNVQEKNARIVSYLN